MLSVLRWLIVAATGLLLAAFAAPEETRRNAMYWCAWDDFLFLHSCTDCGGALVDGEDELSLYRGCHRCGLRFRDPALPESDWAKSQALLHPAAARPGRSAICKNLSRFPKFGEPPGRPTSH